MIARGALFASLRSVRPGDASRGGVQVVRKLAVGDRCARYRRLAVECRHLCGAGPALPVWALDHLVSGALATQREFGAFQSQAQEAVSRPHSMSPLAATSRRGGFGRRLSGRRAKQFISPGSWRGWASSPSE